MPPLYSTWFCLVPKMVVLEGSTVARFSSSILSFILALLNIYKEQDCYFHCLFLCKLHYNTRRSDTYGICYSTIKSHSSGKEIANSLQEVAATTSGEKYFNDIWTINLI